MPYKESEDKATKNIGGRVICNNLPISRASARDIFISNYWSLKQKEIEALKIETKSNTCNKEYQHSTYLNIFAFFLTFSPYILQKREGSVFY